MSNHLAVTIVATCRGGNGLAVQKESLEIMDCNGQGKVHNFAEVIAAAV